MIAAFELELQDCGTASEVVEEWHGAAAATTSRAVGGVTARAATRQFIRRCRIDGCLVVVICLLLVAVVVARLG